MLGGVVCQPPIEGIPAGRFLGGCGRLFVAAGTRSSRLEGLATFLTTLTPFCPSRPLSLAAPAPCLSFQPLANPSHLGLHQTIGSGGKGASIAPPGSIRLHLQAKTGPTVAPCPKATPHP